jgi:hypothetical protein
MSELHEEKHEGGESQHHPPHALLNQNHRRVLASTLRRLELAAWRLEEQLLREEPPRLTLTRFTHAPAPEQHSALLQLVQRIRQEVAALAADYHLEASEQNQARTIMAEFSLLWSDLEDARPQKLRAYGTVNPQAHTVLGPRIQRLIDLTLAIDEVARGRSALTSLRPESERGETEKQE